MKLSKNVLIPVSRIKPNDWNPNVMSTRNRDALRESLGAYGQIYDVLVFKEQNQYIIVDGEHRFHELVDSGATEIYCTVIELEPGDKQADLKKLTLALNNRGENNPDVLTELLRSLEQEYPNVEELINSIPLTADEVLEHLDNSSLDQYKKLDFTLMTPTVEKPSTRPSVVPSKPEIINNEQSSTLTLNRASTGQETVSEDDLESDLPTFPTNTPKKDPIKVLSVYLPESKYREIAQWLYKLRDAYQLTDNSDVVYLAIRDLVDKLD